MVSVTKTDRHEAIRELRQQGHAVGDIAERMGVSRVTIWRHCRGLPEPTPTPAPAPDSNGHLDLEAARSAALGVLLDRAQHGSVSAAGLLFKSASAELRADKCLNHIPADDVRKALLVQYGLWQRHLQGAFVRRILLEFDVDASVLESLVDDAITTITEELNLRFGESEGDCG